MREQPANRFQAASAFFVALALALAGALVLFPRAANAQGLPLTIVVTWASGGGTDKAARVNADFLARGLGQPVKVNNQTGNNNVAGHQSVAEAAPDGLTIGIGIFKITTLHPPGLTPLKFTGYTIVAPKNMQPTAQTRFTTALRRVYLSSKYKQRIGELGLLLLPYKPPAKLGEGFHAENYRNTRIPTALGLAKSSANTGKSVLKASLP